MATGLIFAERGRLSGKHRGKKIRRKVPIKVVHEWQYGVRKRHESVGIQCAGAASRTSTD